MTDPIANIRVIFEVSTSLGFRQMGSEPSNCALDQQNAADGRNLKSPKPFCLTFILPQAKPTIFIHYHR
jgi:hypothetical protein